MLTIGKKAPDFSLSSADGKIYTLKDFAGRKIVLYFYPKDNTSGCTKEARSFEDKRRTIEKNGAVIVGISADSAESHAKFAQKNALTFPLLSDEKKNVLKAYGVWKKKSMYGRKYFGIERTTVLIDEKGIVRHIFHRVSVDGHTDEILDVLKKEK
jgi:thioredoxin-dependent peroxiredoxin